MRLTVNGHAHELAGDPMRALLRVLRDDLDITGPKAGCQQGSCGTCTVLLDGEPRRACLIPAVLADGAAVTTLEGLGDATNLHALQAAFHHYYGAQCGFCTSGMILAAHALLERNASPSRSDIQTALGGHVCRCTGYVKIIEAVEAVARGETFKDVHAMDPNGSGTPTTGAGR